jgi:glycosyltransferase involved in cell wall biosynthesis
MKILWITNTLFPDVCKKLNIAEPVINGWLIGGLKNLNIYNKNLTFAVATLYNGRDFQLLNINNISYYLIPRGKSNKTYDKKIEIHFCKIKKQFSPNIIHIHGTEYPGLLAYVKACGNESVIVSLQGIISSIEQYYFGNISKLKLFLGTTLRDIFRNDTIFKQKKSLRYRSKYEIELLKSVNYIIGRTLWDKSQTQAINPSAQYLKCNETLRDEFYTGETWELENCDKYTIFLSQGYYPIKGLHQIIRALPLIIKQYPNTRIYIAGNNFFSKPWWRLHGYAKYILDLIKKRRLNDKVIFLGQLSPQEMKKRYLKSNVFVCPSAIENSPNSIGEAQILGVPCVASNVGGISDMIEDGVTGFLFRFEEYEILAKKICEIFEDIDLANKLSINGRITASERHNKVNNAKMLNDIYFRINNNKCII